MQTGFTSTPFIILASRNERKKKRCGTQVWAGMQFHSPQIQTKLIPQLQRHCYTPRILNTTETDVQIEKETNVLDNTTLIALPSQAAAFAVVPSRT